MHAINDTRLLGKAPEELLEGYGDLFLEMEGTLESFESLHADIGCAMDDIRDEMERIQEYLDSCAALLRAYRRQTTARLPENCPGSSKRANR